MDQDWDTWDKPYGRYYWRIDLGTATDREIREYTNARLYDLNDAFKSSSGPDAFEWFCEFCNDFKTFTAKDFKDVIQSLLKLLEEYNKPIIPPVPLAEITPPPQSPVNLPFTSFRQESIPLHLQYKELPEEC
ncbi:hypothetical protein NA56DRAFT_697773 [Hyaloscypha hepaticicola]|uniref:Uncharacterized protein n=1 Tax=Hyaloscypha hepaticicola TaxID=2082293 RepID=A0A2J6QJV0_9HELO|nr:hypothetical protein NA56DRAFT_697773 [Hyaloscypha hepaticicola]